MVSQKYEQFHAKITTKGHSYQCTISLSHSTVWVSIAPLPEGQNQQKGYRITVNHDTELHRKVNKVVLLQLQRHNT